MPGTQFLRNLTIFDTAANQPEAILFSLFLFLFKASRSSAGRRGLFLDQATRVHIQAR